MSYTYPVGQVGESTVSSKKWMQQWRQCASYFNKLSSDELLKFVSNTCFTEEAIRRSALNTKTVTAHIKLISN